MKALERLLIFLKEGGVNLKSRKFREIHSSLEKCGFREIGTGCYKVVYHHKEFPKFVIKVFRNRSRDCHSLRELPEKLRKFYLKPLKKTGRFIFQRKCSVKNEARILDKLEKACPLENSGLYHYDIHSENVGILNGKPVFFDFLA